MTTDWKMIAELFKFAPAILALFGVIWLLYRIILKKDETMRAMVDGTQADIAARAKMLALLEILVNRRNGGDG